MILETERTYLRKIEQSDFSALCKILQDKEVMYAYEHAFCCEEVQEWLDKQLKRYNEDGFGLWAILCLRHFCCARNMYNKMNFFALQAKSH